VTDDAAVADVMLAIIGTWHKISDEKVDAWEKFIRRCGTPKAELLEAIDALAEESERMPSIATFKAKLEAIGAIGPAPIGTGDRRVIGRMKGRFLAAAIETCRLLDRDLTDRLKVELGAMDDYLAEACTDDDAAYYRDARTAYLELLRERGVAV
jgi:hypothetical protein